MANLLDDTVNKQHAPHSVLEASEDESQEVAVYGHVKGGGQEEGCAAGQFEDTAHAQDKRAARAPEEVRVAVAMMK